jgi:hypothetical protein
VDVCARCQWRFATASAPQLARPVPASSTPIGSRCPACSRFAGPEAAFCPHCGVALGRPVQAAPDQRLPRAEVVIGHGPRPLGHRIIRMLLTIWLVAYPVVSCGPVILGSMAGGSGAATAVGGILVGWFLFVPWLVGIIVLGLLAILTR